MSVVAPKTMNALEANRRRLHNATAAETQKLHELESTRRTLAYNLQNQRGFFAKRALIGKIRKLNKNIDSTKLRAKSLNVQGMAAKKLINNARVANRTNRGALIPGNNGY